MSAGPPGNGEAAERFITTSAATESGNQTTERTGATVSASVELGKYDAEFIQCLQLLDRFLAFLERQIAPVFWEIRKRRSQIRTELDRLTTHWPPLSLSNNENAGCGRDGKDVVELVRKRGVA